MIETIGYAVIAAIMYAGSMFVKKQAGSENPQDFDAIKFVSTLVVSAVIAVTMVFAGVTVITEADVATQLAAYAGLIAVIENVLKLAYRKVIE